MASTTELESLVVRMSADVEGLLKGMDSVKKNAEDMNRKMVGALDSVQEFKAGLQELGATIASVFGGSSIIDFLKDSREEWRGAETAVFEMNAVLQANGREVDDLSDKYVDFASGIQKMTTYSDEHVMSLVAMAEQYQLTGREAERVVEQTLKFSKATGSGEGMAMRVVKAMQEGDTEMAMMMSKRMLQFRGVKDEQEFELKYQRMLATGQEKMNREIETGAGAAKNFANQFSDMQEEVGKYYSQVIDPVKAIKKHSMEFFNSMDADGKRTAVLIAAWGTAAIVTSGSILTLVKVSQLLGLTWSNLRATTAAFLSNPFVWVAAATTGLILLTNHLQGAGKAAKELQDSLKGVGFIHDKFRESVNERVNKVIEGGDRQAGLREVFEMNKMIQDEQSRIEQMKEMRSSVLKRIGGGSESKGELNAFIGSLSGVKNRTLEEIDRTVEESVKNIETLRGAILSLNDSLDENGKNRSAGEKYANMLNRLDDSFKDMGKTQEEIEFAEIKDRLSFEQIGEFYSKLARNDAKTKIDEAKRSAAEFVKTMEMAARGRDAARGEDWFFSDQLEKLSEHLTQSELDVARWAHRMDVIGKEVAAQEEKTMTPRERFDKEQRRLFELLVEGAGRWDLYEKAVDEAAKSLHEAAAAARDAAASGSAEGLARLVEYNQGTGKRTWGVGAPDRRGRNVPVQGPMPREVDSGNGAFDEAAMAAMLSALQAIERNTRSSGNDVVFGEANLHA